MKIYGKNIICSTESYKNILEHKKVFYSISKLSDSTDNRGGKGGNSNVFKLYDSNEEKHYILKFCKYSVNSKQDWMRDRVYRFENEIKALTKAEVLESANIIKILFSGQRKIGSGVYRYYVMEKGENDLTDFMKENELTVQQKILLCSDILKGIRELHEMEIYHRDIKPDNIFFVDKIWKIGDLGLIDFRDINQEIDKVGEKIGPYGWLSPEATNKYLCEGTDLEKIHSCKIDEFSDIFQLGKLFWYIFQGNIPIGQISRDDFLIDDSILYDIINLMLNYSKTNRPNLSMIKEEFEKTYSVYGI